MGGHIVTERKDAGPVPAIRAPRFVGRDQELAALGETLAGGPSVVLIEGEAGIGKTRLVREYLLSRGAGARSPLVAVCPPFRRPCTLGPVTDAVREAVGGDGVGGMRLSGLTGALRPLFPEWADGLPPAPEPLEDATAARYRLFRALAELLDRLKVTVLVVEDAHWADEATVEFLLFLASRQPCRVSLVVTFRPEDLAADSLLPRLSRLTAGNGGLRIALTSLDCAQAASLVSSMLDGEAVSVAFAEFLHDRTEGLPLAVEELVRLLGERADLRRFDGEWMRRSLDDITVPLTVRDAVLERTRRLGADTVAVLRAAAVLTEPSAEGTLAAVAGLKSDPARRGLRESLASGLLTAEQPNGRGLVAFRHVLAARAIYEATPLPERQEMHARAGQALEEVSPLPLARLASHFREAHETGKWHRYAEEAADVALAAGDEATASTLLHDLVSNAGLPGRDVVRLTGKIPLFSLRKQSFVSDLLQSLRSAMDDESLTPDERTEAGSQIGRVLVSAGEACVPELEAVISGLGDRPVEVVRAMLWLGWPDATLWPAAVHRRWLDKAAAMASDPSIPAAERLHNEVRRATALLMMGDSAGWAAAEGLPADAATPQETLPITFGWLYTGENAIRWGRYGQARQRLSTALALARRHGYPLLRDATLAVQAHLDWFTGAWAGLAEHVGGLASLDDVHPVVHMEAALIAGLLDAAGGAYSRAEQSFRQVLDEAVQRGTVDAQPEPAAALARLALLQGHTEAALALTDDAMRIITSKEIWLWATDLLPIRIQALSAAGRSEEAAGLVSVFARRLRDLDAPAPQAALTLCQAIIAEGQDEHGRAAALFGRAARAWDRLPRPYEALLAHERQATCLHAVGRRDDGMTVLTDVHRGLVELGAAGDADRVTRTLRKHGVSPWHGWRGGHRGYGDQLSPRELEAVRLLVAGHGTRQIAEALCRSPSTVKVQLASAMRKLGASSRTALVARAIETGIAAPR